MSLDLIPPLSSDETLYFTSDDYDYDPSSYEPVVVNIYIVIALYSLSFFIGIPLNGYIIYRLVGRRIKKANHYYRLLMVMSGVDIVMAFFNVVEFYQNDFDYHIVGVDLTSDTLQSILFMLNSIQTIFTLIVIIYWKSVVKGQRNMDKALFAMSSTHLLSLISMFIFTNFMIKFSSEMTRMMAIILGSLSVVILLCTSFICVYCIVLILIEKTDRLSPTTLAAYRRMALAHFIQCLLAEIDFISQTMTWIMTFIAGYTMLLTFDPNRDPVIFQQVHDIYTSLSRNVGYIEMVYCLVPVIKPFMRSTFIAWALRRLLQTEKVEVVRVQRVQPVSSIRSADEDNT